MAQTSWPFENIDTTETQFSQWARNINEGINQGVGDQLQVTADGTGMTVSVGTGQAMIRGHYYSSTATESLTITAADPTNPRIDSVVLELDPTANTVLLKVLAGTPDASPVAPTLTQTDAGVYQLRLANIQVNAATLAIESGDVTDLRPYMFAGIGKWTTATRPTNPVQYQTTGYNTDLNAHEFWNGTSWVGFGDPITTQGDLIVGGASGVPERLPIGADNQVLSVVSGALAWADAAGGGFTGSQLFTASGSWTVPAGVTTCAVFFAGGGGGGGRGALRLAAPADGLGAIGGAGGAGSSLGFYPYYSVTPGTSITVTVGAGGAGGIYGVSLGVDGSASSFDGVESGRGLAGQSGTTFGGYNPATILGGASRPGGLAIDKIGASGGNGGAFAAGGAGIGGTTVTPLAGTAGANGTDGSGTNFGTGGAGGLAGLVGAGGGGAGVFNSGGVGISGAGAGLSGGGGGGGGAHTGLAIAGNGGDGAPNTGAGGGGGGASTSTTSGSVGGNGGNGGSGFVLVLY